MYKPTETKKCLYCDREIYKDVWRSAKEWEKRKYCDRTCFGKHKLGSKKEIFGEAWNDEEIDFLKKLAGKKSIAQLVKAYNCKAKKEGWVERSRNAIAVKLTRSFLSRKPTENNFSARQLALILGISHTRIQVWIRQGLLDREKQSPHLAAISRHNFKKFAISNPEKLWGIDPKNLRRILGKNESKLIRRIAVVNSSTSKNGGCPVTLVRLDTGEVFDSIESAVVRVQVELDYSFAYLKEKIGECSKSDKEFVEVFPKRRLRSTPLDGIDWTRLQYPTYWIPYEIKPEFDRLAGELLHWFYLELRNLDGYSKTSCLAIASKNAVNLALWSFRRQQKDKDLGKELTAKEVLLDKVKQVVINKILFFEKLDSQAAINKIKGAFMNRVYSCFHDAIGFQNRERIHLNSEECALEFIYKMSERYFRKSYLPKNYQPQNKLEKADLLANIYSSILCHIEVRENVLYSLAKLFAWKYIQRNQLNSQLSIESNFATVATGKELALSDNSAEVEMLMDKIKTFYPRDYQELSIFVALKLEEASDNEIADCMNIPISTIPKYLDKLRKCFTSN